MEVVGRASACTNKMTHCNDLIDPPPSNRPLLSNKCPPPPPPECGFLCPLVRLEDAIPESYMYLIKESHIEDIEI